MIGTRFVNGSPGPAGTPPRHALANAADMGKCIPPPQLSSTHSHAADSALMQEDERLRPVICAECDSMVCPVRQRPQRDEEVGVRDVIESPGNGPLLNAGGYPVRARQYLGWHRGPPRQNADPP